MKGINNIGIEYSSEIIDLRDKLFKMNLNLVGDLLDQFIVLLEQLNQEKSNEKLKKDASITALKIISTSRMFETIINIEIIKRYLQSGVDS